MFEGWGRFKSQNSLQVYSKSDKHFWCLERSTYNIQKTVLNSVEWP